MSAISVRLPDSIHKMAREVAIEDNISLNQFIASAVAEKLSALKTEAFFRERAESANQGKTLSVLDSVRKLPPVSEDELPG